MKSIIKAMALSLGMAVLLSFASCSNGSSGNDDETSQTQNENGQKVSKTLEITGTDVAFSSDSALQAFTADQFADYEITAMTVSVQLSGTATDGNNWWAGISNPEWLSLEWTDSPSVEDYSYEAAVSSELISDAKTSGIWIKANPGLTAKSIATITYTTYE